MNAPMDFALGAELPVRHVYQNVSLGLMELPEGGEGHRPLLNRFLSPAYPQAQADGVILCGYTSSNQGPHWWRMSQHDSEEG